MKNKKRKIVFLGSFIILMFIILMFNYNRKLNDCSQEKSIFEGVNIKTEGQQTVTEIEGTENILLNPGKGSVLYESELDPKYDNVVSTGYMRYSWSAIEPREGEYNWDIIDKAINNYSNAGKKFAFGIMCANTSYDTTYITPKWVFDAGAKGEEKKIEGLKHTQMIPIWTDAIFLDKLNHLIEAMAQRYDGNPNLAYIDIRSYGNWGEQHLGKIGGIDLSPEQLQELYMQPYKDNFHHTLLVNPWGKKEYNEIYQWGIENGISIRRDGIFKYSDGTECLMAYGKLPSIFEFVYGYEQLKEENLWSTENLLTYIETGKPSYLELSKSMYCENIDFCNKIANKIGYYFRLNGVEYKNVVQVKEQSQINLKITNEGVAPLYEPCTVYIGLLDENAKLVKKYKTDLDPHTWMPNEKIEETLTVLYEDVAEGKYIIALGLFLDEKDEKPTYLLGNKGNTADNWYVFGEIEINSLPERYDIDSQNQNLIINGNDQYLLNVVMENLQEDAIYQIKVINNDVVQQNMQIQPNNGKFENQIEILLNEERNHYQLQVIKNDEIVSEFEQEIYVAFIHEKISKITDELIDSYRIFEEEFKQQISKVSNLEQDIQLLKRNISELKNVETISNITAQKIMLSHYHLGNKVIDVYGRNKEITGENIELSMLIQIHKIGQLYDNLLIISEGDKDINLTETEQSIKKVQAQIDQNQDLDIIYPTKILEFSQDYYEKANYINNLEEENEIKTGLIVSKNLHAKYLASWAEQFTNLYLDEYIEANPLTLSYSQTNLTNQDVTVTLSAPYDFQVTNNHQAKTYTFTQNGSFTFHYSIRGQAKEITATVTNIDKTPPTITGVEEGKLYFDEAKPIVQDENLQEVKLIVNDQVFESYETNTTIKVEGIYQLIATDKAGNQTKVSFEIIETPDLNYQIKEDKILNIKNNTTKSIFDQTIRINTSYQIKRQNKVLTNADKIATGDILETSGGQTYALIVAGDIDGDGEVGTIDLVKMRKYLLGAIELNDIEKLAADANVDGKAVGIQDLVRLRILILSKDN